MAVPSPYDPLTLRLWYREQHTGSAADAADTDGHVMRAVTQWISAADARYEQQGAVIRANSEALTVLTARVRALTAAKAASK